ncbi:ABC transporter ATP-binding protein [soil metagenome]
MTAALSVSSVTRRFEPTEPPALDAVDLDVAAGTCTALLGPSGSGKTTLLRTIAGLEPAYSGTVRLDGADLTGVAAERRGMAMVFQRPLLFPHLSVHDNVAFPGRARGLARAAAREEAARFLDLVGLSHLTARDVRALSGGQQQRVALARALAARPRLLLLDEPFAALDPSLADEMRELVLELRAVLEPTVVMVTHDHEEASVLADDVAVLIDGRLVQHEPVEAIYRRPANIAVHRLLGGVNELPGTAGAGRHRSALGELDLPPEALGVTGEAVLLVRHEQVRLVAPADPAAHLAGAVETVRQRGGRRRVTVCRGGVQLVAEVPVTHPVRVGEPVGLVVPPDAVWPVPVSGGDQPSGQVVDSSSGASGRSSSVPAKWLK